MACPCFAGLGRKPSALELYARSLREHHRQGRTPAPTPKDEMTFHLKGLTVQIPDWENDRVYWYTAPISLN